MQGNCVGVTWTSILGKGKTAMGRRREPNLFELLIVAPWWVSFILGGGTLYFASGLPKMFTSLGFLFGGVFLLLSFCSLILGLLKRPPGKKSGVEDVRAGYSAFNGAMTCPRCGAKMVVRKAYRGIHKGHYFYGCSRFPFCWAIVNM